MTKTTPAATLSRNHPATPSPTPPERVAIIGLGYVGLPSAVFFAEAGFEVIGADVRSDAVREIAEGRSHLPDLGMDGRIQLLVQGGRLRATDDVQRAVREADVILIMVPTPLTEAREPDLSFVVNAGRMVGQALRKGQLVILESTVYPGVTEDVLRPELERGGLRAGIDFGLAYCPERYNPGDSDHTIERTSRIVGGIDAESAQRAATLYGAITDAGVVQVADIRTCEAAKIIENTQRDLNIALMNEFALILEHLRLDVSEVLAAAATKWNFVPYRPGGGVGGHCLPKDPYYLTKTAEKAGYRAKLITAGRDINDAMPRHVYDLLVRGLRSEKLNVKGARVAVLGLSYKAEIGDTRSSPSSRLCQLLHEAGAILETVDPYVPAGEAERAFHATRHHTSIGSLTPVIDAVILMVGHRSYMPLPLQLLRRGAAARPVLVDAPRLVPPADATAAGFRYLGVGAGRNNPPP